MTSITGTVTCDGLTGTICGAVLNKDEFVSVDTLAGGTTRQVLEKASSTDLDFVWSSDYAKLAIEITTADFFQAITDSELIAGQWYLITDFQNICTIADSQSTVDYTTGDIEQIYVKALSTNTLQREAVSKTFPDEVVEFNPTFADVTASLSCQAYGNGSGVDNSYTTLTADTYGSSVDELQFGGTLVDEFDDAIISNYIYYYNGISGNEFYLYGYEKDNIWEYDDENDIFKLNKTPYRYYDEYSSGSSSFFSISITDATHFVLGCPAWIDFVNQRDSDDEETYFYLSDGENEETYNFSQKGVTWDYDAETDTITILSGSVSLTHPDIYIELCGTSYCDNTAYNTQFSTNGLLDLSADGSSMEIDASYTVYTNKGKIEARRNMKLDFYCQADYRVQKVRRYKALCNNWAAGTYNAGNIVRYSSYIYIALKTTTQTPSTSATNWFRMFGDNYNLAGTIYISCAATSISTTLTVDPASYTDMYICNGYIANFDALTEKMNTQILKHPDADQTKPFNVSFYAGFHGCQNAIITADKTHFITNVTNSTVNFISSVLNSVTNYSTISSGQYCILWQNTYLNALQLYQVLAYSIDYSIITYSTNSIFRNGITKSNFISVSSCVFAAKPTDCSIVNLSTTDQWGSSFSGTDISKMYNCTFNSSVLACQFYGDIHYTTWYSNCYRNKFIANCYGSSNSVRQTFCYMADNFFAKNVAINYFSSSGNIVNNSFFGSFSNNGTSSVPISSSARIDSCTFNGNFYNNTGSGTFNITSGIFRGFSHNIFNNTGRTVYFTYCSALGDIGGSSGGNTFNNTTENVTLEKCNFIGDFYLNTLTRGTLTNNIFLGVASANTWGGTSTFSFANNICGPQFTGNTINASASKNNYPPYFTSQAISSSTYTTDITKVNGFAKNTISTTSASYTVEDKYSVVFLTSTIASQTVVLPATKGSQRQITIVKLSGLSYPATIDANASDIIEDALTYTLNRQYEAVTLQDKEVGKWYVVDGYKDEPYIYNKQIPYGDSEGNITSESGFEYDASTNTLSVPNIETTYLKVGGTEEESIIAEYRDKDGEDVFTALGSISDGDFEFKIGDYAGAGNETGYKLDYANEKHVFKNDVDISGNATVDEHIATPQIKAPDADGLLLTDDGDNGIFVKDGGNVGIGTTAPINKLTVYGSGALGDIRTGFSDGSSWSIGRDNITTGDFVFVDGILASTERMRIQHTSGNVGIGTTAPGEKLEVSGNIKATGYKTGTETGITTTQTVVSDVRDNAGQMQKKTVLLTFTNGLLTAQGAESAWTDTTDI